MKIQVTLIDKTGAYKPISTLVEVKNMVDFNLNKAKYINKAFLQIRKQKGDISLKQLQTLGYTSYKCREYDLEKINRKKQIKKLQEIYQKRLDKSKP